ncbi:MAG: SUMF1/EgtB/PvdO family nonheme iron enzyme, partial [Planctomycetes bacterium]|nr:SUMF1/EgtB/PvdO family nonheme iron enzyme [Planctomycetota bacterium]
PTPLHSVNPKVNHDLEIVIHTAMDKDRDRRYQTAEDLANDLRRVRKHEPILARPAGLMLRLQRWYQRNPALARSVFAAVAILVMGTVASSLLAARANRESRRADRENMEYRRLADFSRLDELQAEARDQLWPARERTIPAIQDWLGRARRLAAQLPVHRAALEELRRSGKLQRTVLAGIDGADVAQQKRNLIFENEELERFWRQALDTGDAAPQDEEALDQRMDWIERSLANLDDGTVNEVWVFESTDLQWRHDQLMTLVEKLEAFVTSAVTETSGLRSVEARLEHARDVISTTIDAHRTLWDTTLVEIASSPRYAGLEMEPQAGLVPLGMSPQGYAEFAHCASGAIPRRAASGELELSEDSAIVLVLLPGGVFHMGSPLSEEAREDPEAMHDVFLEPYFIGKFEVSQGQWVALMGSNPAEYPPGSIIKGNPVDQPVTLLHPVETVTWRQCTDFSRRADLELPTEAQWEFACRGGRNTAYAWGDAAECLIDRANVGDQALLRVNPRYSQLTCVAWNDGWGTHAPIQNGACNDFGLYGLHGNLSEWTRDRYALYFP